jgi:hypothetical protein
LLLDAALLDEARAVAAFAAWCRQVNLEAEFGRAAYRLLPLVYDRMHSLGVHAPVMGRLKGVYRRAWYDTHRLFHAVQPVVAGLVAAGIDVMLTKGAPLALTGYRQPGLRPMADVDVVVPPDRLSDAFAVLGSLGWRADFALSPDVVRFRHAVACHGPAGGEIDLHWRVLYESRHGDDRTFHVTAQPLDFLGTVVSQPDATHHLFLLIVHGVRWNEEPPVRWIVDVVALLRARGHEVDWERLPELAAAYRVSVRVGLGLAYLAGTFRVPVPPGVLERLGATRVSILERFENRVLLARDEFHTPSPLRNQWIWLAEYGRRAEARGPLEFALGYTHFLRYAMGLNGRRELVPRLVRGLGRRIRGAAREAPSPTRSGEP